MFFAFLLRKTKVVIGDAHAKIYDLAKQINFTYR